MTWSDSFLRSLKDNDVRLVTYVPDNVLTPLIAGAAADNYFMSVGATREDEARHPDRRLHGRAARRGDDADQRFRAHCERARVAGRALPDPGDHRGLGARHLGEFNTGQATVARTLRPTLDSIAVTHHTLTDEATMPFIVDKSIKQAFTTQSPVVFILSPLLTGGNPLAAAKLK
jgi:sulfopyruvate decarboxylase TPP-binding subunit